MSSITSTPITHRIEEPTFEADSFKGKARITFFDGDRRIHEQMIDVRKMVFDTQTGLTLTSEIGSFKVSGSLTLPSTLPSGLPPQVYHKYNEKQIAQARQIALTKLHNNN